MWNRSVCTDKGSVRIVEGVNLMKLAPQRDAAIDNCVKVTTAVCLYQYVNASGLQLIVPCQSMLHIKDSAEKLKLTHDFHIILLSFENGKSDSKNSYLFISGNTIIILSVISYTAIWPTLLFPATTQISYRCIPPSQHLTFLFSQQPRGLFGDECSS